MSSAQAPTTAARFRQAMAFLRPYRRGLVTASILTGVLTLIGMAPPLLMRSLVNDVARQGRWNIFWLVMGLLFAVPVLRAGVNIANAIVLHTAAQSIIRDTRKGLFAHLMSLSMRFFGQMPPGAISQRIIGDVGTVSGLAGGGLVAILGDIILVVFSVVVMLGLSVKLSLLTFALLPLYYLNTWFFSRRISAANVQLRSRMDHISSMLQERLSAHELIQAYGQDKREATQFSSYAKQIMDAAVRGQAYSISFNQVSAFINKVGNTAIYCGACWAYIRGTMGYGDVIAFCAYATQLLGPIVRFSAVANQLVQVGVSVDRIDEIARRKPAIVEVDQPETIQRLDGRIEARDVNFTYRGGEQALRGVDFTIPAGSHVAVVGPPGSGRSTLAMLLRRFYDPDDGLIRVDDTDVKHYRLKDYRKALALVLSESTLFDGTLRENLLYGNPEAPQQTMVEVCRAVGLHGFVDSLKDGYDTRLGTGGLKLPVGVVQQIGVARALVSEPDVLIVDEATASLDADTAETVHRGILERMHGRTCIEIVHRLALARRADLVVVLDDGHVVETGTHAQLVARPGGLYRTMYEAQYGPPSDSVEGGP